MTSFPKLSPEELQKKFAELSPTYRSQQNVGEIIFMLKPLRRRIMSRAGGRILDVACGTGENFRFFPKDSPIIAVDLSSDMLEQAREEAHRQRLQAEIKVMDAQKLDFPDASFDSVTTALSTCTIPDPILALCEMARVCRPDGRILLFEHGRSSWGWAGRWMDNHADGQFRSAACRWNQEPIELVKQAGLKIVWAQRARLGGVFAMIEAMP